MKTLEERNIDEICRWLIDQHLDNDIAYEKNLPEEIKNLSIDNKVFLIKTEHDYYFLLKQKIYGKENFEGIFVCCNEISDSLLKNDMNGKKLISIENGGILEELYFRKKLSEKQFWVYFDLN